MPLKEWLAKKHERRKKVGRKKSEESVLTDDPLSTLVYPRKVSSVKKVDQIYAVSRVNPLFDDSDENAALEGQRKATNDTNTIPESISSGFPEEVEDETNNYSTVSNGSDFINNSDSQRGSSISNSSIASTSTSPSISGPIEVPVCVHSSEDGGTSGDDAIDRSDCYSEHDSSVCLGIPRFDFNGSSSEIASKIDLKPEIKEVELNLTEELIIKRKNLRHVSPKASPIMNRKFSSDIESDQDESLNCKVDKVVCSEWKQSVATIKKMWQLENQTELPPGEMDSSFERNDDRQSGGSDDDPELQEVDPEICISSVETGTDQDSVHSEDSLISSEAQDASITKIQEDDTSENCGNAPNVPNEQSTFCFSELNEKVILKNLGSDQNFSIKIDNDQGTKRKVHFADQNGENESKLLTDEILNGHHILAARGRFTNPLLLQSKLYSIKTSLPNVKTEGATLKDLKNNLENRISSDQELKSIMIDELYSSYTFEVQGYDKSIEKTDAKKKRRKVKKIIWISVGILLLIGFVVAITLYLKVIS